MILVEQVWLSFGTIIKTLQLFECSKISTAADVEV